MIYKIIKNILIEDKNRLLNTHISKGGVCGVVWKEESTKRNISSFCA